MLFDRFCADVIVLCHIFGVKLLKLNLEKHLHLDERVQHCDNAIQGQALKSTLHPTIRKEKHKYF